MKIEKASTNKMVKAFDKELKNLLLGELKVIRLAKTAFNKNITRLKSEQLMTA